MASTVPEEIAGLRGLSIIAIILHNMWPEFFPNAYCGIDINFMLLGYLLGVCSSEHSVSVSAVAIFYYKRAKHIFPLYFLTLPMILVLSYLTIGIGWLQITDTSALYSLPFLTNVKNVWDREDYFNAFRTETSTKDTFRHLWAICVEVQCYFISPVAFLCLQVLKKRALKIICLSLICLASCCLYYLSSSYWAYMSLPCRLWQFGLGAMAFVIVNNQRTEAEAEPIYLSSCTYSVSFILISAAFLSLTCMLGAQEITEIVMRPLVSLSCFVLLFVQTNITKKILSCKILTSLGIIAYPLYLIHWPLILLFGSKLSPQITIGVILALSYVCHNYYEKKCRNLGPVKVLLLFCGLALLNLYVYLAVLRCPVIRNSVNNYYYNKVPEKMREALEDNLDFARHPAMQPSAIWNSSSIMIHPSFKDYGIYDYMSSYGEKKVAILGDTYALNQMETIYEEFQGNYSQFKAVVGFGLTGLYDKWDGGNDEKHQGQYEAAIRVIENFEPDILFLISRHRARLSHTQSVASFKLLTQTVNKNLMRLEKTCGIIFIHGAMLCPPLGHLTHLIDAISTKSDLSKFNLNKTVVDRVIQKRQSFLNAIQCSKCLVYNTNFNFANGSRFLTYDPTNMISYFDNSHHLTEAGLEKVRGTYFELISDALL